MSPKRMALAISGLAFAGATALTMGAASPASAQTTPSTSQHIFSCGWDWGWDDCGCWDGWW
jgi:hypothetical protein